MEQVTEAQASIDRMRAKLQWLSLEALRQARLGNLDTSTHFYRVAKAAEGILESLTVYVSRNPLATKRDLLEILSHIARDNG